MPFFQWLQRYQLQIFGLAVLLLGSGLLVASLIDNEPAGIEFAYGSGIDPGSPIRVHVTGAVVSPGVYELREGDRLLEALAAAGGPADNADAGNLNLARRVRDEERIEVPARAGSSAPAGQLAPGEKVDINTASQKQLEALPGIGEAYSRRIVDSRKVDGPYKTIRDLVDRKVIPASTFEKISELITAGP